MSGEIYTTICGNLTEDASLRFTTSGAAVANVSIASTPRIFKDGAWADGETTYIRGSIWRQPAENVAESLTKGMRVIAYGKLKQRSWDDKDTGAKRTVIELDIEEIGPSLKYSTAKVQRVERVGVSTGSSGRGSSAPADDPWGSTPPSGGYDDSAPF